MITSLKRFAGGQQISCYSLGRTSLKRFAEWTKDLRFEGKTDQGRSFVSKNNEERIRKFQILLSSHGGVATALVSIL